VLVPLFSCPGRASWGIGEIADLSSLTAWLAAAGQRALQLLPINEMAANGQSPYSAMSAMAIDPLYISLASVPDFDGESSLPAEDRAVLARVRQSSAIDYTSVRRLKRAALRTACARFLDAECRHETQRWRAFTAFLADQAWWIEDYGIFRSLHARGGDQPWTGWPEPLRRRDPAALAGARRELADEVLFHQYVQWLAHCQWQRARAESHGVALLGDLPFMVGADSADVWARQDQFDLDVSVGAPPDAFSATGQDWGMPLYRWDVIARDGFSWLRERARRNADIYDGFRIDHVVGFYRTYGRPSHGDPFFTPSTESEQRTLGEWILTLFRKAGAHVFAEDLGVIPDFVRASMAALGVPGFRVLRWERYWHTDGKPFRDPSDYPALSVAVSGTHDTETLAAWWDGTSAQERGQIASLPTVRRIAGDATRLTAGRYTPEIRDVLLETIIASRSDLTLLPVQDVFGWSDRINQPATVNDANWTFRLPWPVDGLDDVAEARERRARLRAWSEVHGRI
jgi:4-alpha-glucanotransferase